MPLPAGVERDTLKNCDVILAVGRASTKSADQPTDAPASRRGPLSHECLENSKYSRVPLEQVPIDPFPSPQTPLFLKNLTFVGCEFRHA